MSSIIILQKRGERVIDPFYYYLDNMTRKELVDKIASVTGVMKLDTKMMVNALVRAISEELEEGRSVRLPELGTFSIGVVYNLLMSGNMTFPEQKRVRFRPSKRLKDRVNR